MRDYFIKRMLLIIPTFLGITIITFLILQAVPGGPLEIEIMKWKSVSNSETGVIHSKFNVSIPESALFELKKFYGFDKPVIERYFIWLGNLLTLNMGKSYVFGEPVWEVIKKRFPISVYFGLIGFFITYIVCIPLGIVKAIRHGQKFDFISSVVVFFGYSMPGWTFGALTLMLFGGGGFFNIFPLGGFVSLNFSSLNFVDKIFDLIRHTILHVSAYLVGSFATLTILTKNSILENISKDYVTAAYAKGLTQKQVYFRHIFRNSLIPISTGLGHFLSLLITGSFLIESVFNIQGMGLLGFSSIVQRDYPVVMGLLVLSSLLLLSGNILSDLLYVLFDPRIKFKVKN